MARRVEAAGFDSIWLYDHLLYRWPGRGTDGVWECWTVLSALAAATQRLELGTIVLAAPFRNPALVAKMAVTLDEISGGRLTLGLGSGWHQPEFDAFGAPFDHRVARLEEALAIIGPLLRDGRVDFRGKYYRAEDCEILPRGPRAAGPPLLVAAARPRMLELVARHADAWNTAWHASAESVVEPIRQMRAVCAEVGRDPESLTITACVAVAYPQFGVGRSASNTQLTGGASQVAEALHGFRRAGVAHAIVEVAPFDAAAIDEFAAALREFRAGEP